MSQQYSQYQVNDPRQSGASNGQYTSHFTQSQSQYIPNSNQQSQFVQQQTYHVPAQHTQFTTSVYQPNPISASYLTESVNSTGNKNIQDVIESVKRSAAIRQSQQQQQQQVPVSQNIQPQVYTTNVSSSNYGQYGINESASFQPQKFTSSLTTSQPFQNILTNSYNLNVPNQNINYLQTPDRQTQIKGSNVKIYTPNKSPSTCKIVFGGSPSKQQIQQEIDQFSMRALTESQANQKSVDCLRNTIQFISATNSSPEKRQTAKSLLNTMNGGQ